MKMMVAPIIKSSNRFFEILRNWKVVLGER